MFYRFECHSGDDNNNSISEIIREAPSEDEAWRMLPTLPTMHKAEVLEALGYATWKDDALYQTWEEVEGIPEHEDYYLVGKHETLDEAENAIARYHGRIF